MLVFGVLLVLLGFIVQVALSQALITEVDRTLMNESEGAIGLLFPNRPPDSNGPGGGRPAPRRGPEGYRGGTFFVGYAPDGTQVANPQQVTVSSNLTWPQTRDPAFATITLGDGDQARVVLRRTADGGLLMVGQSLGPEQTALRTLLIVLATGGGLGLMLSLGAAWFLAGRALIPIELAFRRQQEFVADASHELRTPLTVLRSATDLMNQHRSEPLASNGELFDDVRAEIQRMERLAQDLLTLARSDAGGLELMTAPLDLSDVAAEVVRRTTPLASSGGIKLGLDAPAELATVEADPDRLQQVLYILIDNAIKHTPPGGVIDVRVRRTGQLAQIVVSDTGSGISAEHLPRIFDRFYRGDKARTRAAGGTGLGLAIAKMLVDAHHGQLSITSTVGVGTHVTVSLAVAHPPARHSGRLAGLATHLPQVSLRR